MFKKMIVPAMRARILVHSSPIFSIIILSSFATEALVCFITNSSLTLRLHSVSSLST